MAGPRLDPRHLKPADLVRLLNGTPLGEVLTERRLYRHRQQGGRRIAGDAEARTVDLLRYAGWLCEQIDGPRAEAAPSLGPLAAEGYEAIREEARSRRAGISRSGRDIAPLPAVVDPGRKEKCRYNLKLFLETYHKASFPKRWSRNHLTVIAKVERLILKGGRFALAMPRGDGKTTLLRKAAEWAALYGHSRYICLLAANGPKASQLLEPMKTSLETNRLYREDFPEVSYPIRRLERIVNRSRGQLYNGEPTRISWTADKIILPSIPGSAASGIIVTACGLESGSVRGQFHELDDGTILRPTLVIADDPQTRESAGSEKQTQDRIDILSGDAGGLAGPGESMSLFALVTIIYQGDLAERLTNRKESPAWQGELMSMMPEMPTTATLWDEYAKLWEESLDRYGDIRLAAALYRQHRCQAACRRKLDQQRPCGACPHRETCMDAGAVVAWPERYEKKKGELSAVQHAMDLKLEDEEAFWAEFQNRPKSRDKGSPLQTVEQLMQRVNGLKRGTVPLAADKITAYIDVGDHVLFWVVTAWRGDFTGWVLDYGTFPEQRRSHFTAASAQHTLDRRYPGLSREATVQEGLLACIEELSRREYVREDAAVMQIGRGLIDTGHLQDEVYAAIRRSGRGGVWMAAKGVGIGARNRPVSEFRKESGGRYGFHWWVPPIRGKRVALTVNIDTNFWKTFLVNRLAPPVSEAAALSFWGLRPADHRLYCEHLTAEKRETEEARGGTRRVDVWTVRRGGRDNHWLDCTVGCCVAASYEGVKLSGLDEERRRRGGPGRDAKGGPMVLSAIRRRGGRHRA